MKRFAFGIVGSLIACTLVHADSNKPTKNQTREIMACGYNQSAGVKIEDGFNVGISGSFIYLQPTQDNMCVGFVANPSADIPLTGALDPIDFKFNYKPGFEVSANVDLNHDDWGLLLDYMWLHSTTSTSKSVPAGTIIYPTYGHPLIQGESPLGPGALVYEFVKSSWNLKLDFADLSVFRSFFVGQHLSFKTLYGIRGAWIRQTQNTVYVGNDSAPFFNADVLDDSTTTNRLKMISWGVGPRFEIDTDWNIGAGISFFGNAGADLLYTRYNLDYSDLSVTTDTTTVHGNLSARERGLQFVRPHADLEFGFSYGTYFANQGTHMQFTAGYGFQVFWDQNMVWKFVTGTDLGVGFVPNGNLYLQGMRLTLDFDF